MSCLLLIDDTESTEKINIDDLYEKKKNRDLKQLSIFNKVLHRIHKRILTTARNKQNDKHIWFVVPEYIFGEPCYQNADCIAYIINQLKNNGFTIRYIHPNTLFVSWENHIPTYVRNQIKKKTGVLINEKGEVLSSSSSSQQSSGDEQGPGQSSSSSSSSSSSGNRAAAAANQRTTTFNAIQKYKPTGVYERDGFFDKIDKKLSASSSS